jgi:site-specific DNA-cytosine methylase
MVRLGGNIWEGTVPTLRAEAKRGDAEPHILIIDGTRVDDVRVYDDDMTPCLKNRMGTGGNNVPFVAYPIQDEREMEKKQNGLGIGQEGEPSYTLDQTGAQSIAAFAIQGTTIGRQDHNGPQGKVYGEENGPMYTLDSVSQHGVALAYDEYNNSIGGEIHHALRAGTRQSNGVLTQMQVRRLTPVECERLMGWPDNHTLHRADGKTNSDTTRYKMCGNGVASPVAQWMAEQINLAENGL